MLLKLGEVERTPWPPEGKSFEVGTSSCGSWALTHLSLGVCCWNLGRHGCCNLGQHGCCMFEEAQASVHACAPGISVLTVVCTSFGCVFSRDFTLGHQFPRLYYRKNN